jgi:hypothetical protein
MKYEDWYKFMFLFLATTLVTVLIIAYVWWAVIR